MSDTILRLGPETPETPVLVSVPHAGRDFPPGFAAMTRLSQQQLRILEDRHADALAAACATGGHGVLAATVPRCWIDLNRAEADMDLSAVHPQDRSRFTQSMGAKARGGLGIVPSRISNGGAIWRAPLSADAIDDRVRSVHRPYHTAVAEALEQRRARFGIAVLLDLHSMPPPRQHANADAARVVFGSLFGRSCDSRFTTTALGEVAAAGFAAALNVPFAGGHILERHGAPADGIHALQLEVDRSLYLDTMLDGTGAGLPTMQRLVLRIADCLAAEALARSLPIAAE